MSPPEAEVKCEIIVQFLTFSCRNFRINILQTHNEGFELTNPALGTPLMHTNVNLIFCLSWILIMMLVGC